jgi:hypothetical protein
MAFAIEHVEHSPARGRDLQMILGIDMDAEYAAERVHEPSANESLIAIVQLDAAPRRRRAVDQPVGVDDGAVDAAHRQRGVFGPPRQTPRRGQERTEEAEHAVGD